MRRIIIVLVAGFALLAQPAVAGAATAPEERPARPSKADANRDRIADGLEPRLGAASERVDVIVTFSKPVSAAAAQRAVGRFDVGHEYSIVDGFSATMTAGQVRALARRDDVFRIEAVSRVEAFLDTASDDFGAASARSTFGVDGSGVGVCVIDTGADPNHVSLDGGKIVAWKDWTSSATTPYDDHGHGTHVAATAVGDGTGSANAATYIGVAPAASAYIAKVLDGNGFGSNDDVIAAIQWCQGFAGVDVISMSLGDPGLTDGQDAVSQAANAAVASGVVTVAAAGNSGDEPNSIGSPGAAEDVLSVGAMGDTSAGGFRLARFSSRGPTADGRIKPDIVAPGMNITAAQAGTVDGYQTMSGTSMATPYVAGLVALALDRDDTLTPAEIETLVASTARDAGPSGKDGDYGWGLIDGHALVAEAGGATSYTSFAMPTHTAVAGTVPNGGQWTQTFTLSSADLSVPIGATLLIDGQIKCAYRAYGFCWAWEWSPDLDIELLGPGGSVVASSQCALAGDCYRGRTETITFSPSVPGTYTWRIYPASDSVNQNRGGTFQLDYWRGPKAGGSSPPPPPPSNEPPVANAGPDQTVTDSDGSGTETVTLDGSASSDPDGSITSYDWSENGSTIATGATANVSLAVGVHTITLTVTDDGGLTDTDEVVITIEEPTPPPPAGSVHIADLDGATVSDKGSWSAVVEVAVHDDGHASVEGATVSGTWSDGSSGSCLTGSDGRCPITGPAQPKRDKSATFTVTGITAGDPYAPAGNHDPDGDSDGTAITVSR